MHSRTWNSSFPWLLSALLLSAAGFSLPGCSQPSQPSGEAAPGAASGPATAGGTKSAPAERQALFGAVHVHTRYSFDAFTNGTVTEPDLVQALRAR